MNSIERVKAAIHFTRPDRVPVYKAGIGDAVPLVMLPPKSWQPGHAGDEEGLFPYLGDEEFAELPLWRWKKPKWAKAKKYKNWMDLSREEIDEWGVIWKRAEGRTSIGHPLKEPLTNWDDYDRYRERYNPDPTDESRYRTFSRFVKILGRKKYRLAILGNLGPFSLAGNIRGFNNFLMDHMTNPQKLKVFLSHLTDYFIAAIDMWEKFASPHGFILYDDLASQQRPFIRPSLFAEFYEPVFRTIIEKAHSLDIEVHLHSCGKIDQLISSLIEWGLDALELDSPRMTGYCDLAPFRGQIMMWGCVNIQTIYPNGTGEECEREVWHMVRNLGTEKGGYGAYLYPQPQHIGVAKENITAFENGLKKYGVYENIPPSWWAHPTAEEWEPNEVPPLPPLP
jgi:Uroporphyrinogen decarboxylase (URO-D)